MYVSLTSTCVAGAFEGFFEASRGIFSKGTRSEMVGGGLPRERGAKIEKENAQVEEEKKDYYLLFCPFDVNI